jgi:hypothetical protein
MLRFFQIKKKFSKSFDSLVTRECTFSIGKSWKKSRCKKFRRYLKKYRFSIGQRHKCCTLHFSSIYILCLLSRMMRNKFFLTFIRIQDGLFHFKYRAFLFKFYRKIFIKEKMFNHLCSLTCNSNFQYSLLH